MSPKRGDRVSPPPGDEWDVRYATTEAVKGWDNLCRQSETNALWAWRLMRTDPEPVAATPRHHRLRGELAIGRHDGRQLPPWQLEVTSKGRVWYLADAERHTVWMVLAGTAHPKATE